MNIAAQIIKIRESMNMSQEKFAGELGVSRQAVQKWEAGTSQPELANVVAIAKRFQVSMDTLLLGTKERFLGEAASGGTPKPAYDGIHPWESFSREIMQEYVQSMAEGRDMERLEGLFREVNKLPAGEHKEAICDVLFRMSLEAPMRKDYPYYEPSELEDIRKSRALTETGELQRPDPAVMAEKIRGAWNGRIVGCLLGKTVEGISGRELLELLQASGNYPMHRYIRSGDITEEIRKTFEFSFDGRCFADQIDCAPADDDTNYTVMASELVERYGREFTPRDVSRMWLAMQPKDAYCTAERIAFLNFVNGYQPPQSAIYKNVFREWIGAQIRGDYFGFINPGDPQKAAEMAWRDGSISHVKNGIYGEMYVAAMLAAAACTDDMEAIIRRGIQEIPEKCRLREAVCGLLQQKHDGVPCEEVFAGIRRRWKNVVDHWCHTISNAEIVTAALLYGGGDFGKSICLAVQAAYDTDCNGATVGAIVGMARGKTAISSQWLAPVNGLLQTNLFGLEKIGIEKLAERTMRHAGY